MRRFLLLLLLCLCLAVLTGGCNIAPEEDPGYHVKAGPHVPQPHGTS